jgi:4-amino-4-deoxy-L-arabinose transferase-like glycosyltransferase
MKNCGFTPMFAGVALTLSVVSAILHLWNLGEIPRGFYVDESAIGYSAYCIAETGADEYGVWMPMFFRCFDNYHDPVMVYILAPMVKVFGLHPWVIRLPSALFLLGAAFAFYFLAGHYTDNCWIKLGGAFLFSVTPWVFPVSRSTMAGYTPMLLGIVLGWYIILRLFETGQNRLAAAAAFFWALAMYAHNCGRPESALYIGCLFIAGLPTVRQQWKRWLAFIAWMTVFLLPMLVHYARHPESLNRFNQVSVFNSVSDTSAALFRITSNYFGYFSPSFLFVTGDPNLRHNIGVGALFLFTIPFLVAGLYVVIRRFNNPHFRFVFLGLLASPVIASLTMDAHHFTRSLNGLPFWIVLTVVGCDHLARLAVDVTGARLDKPNRAKLTLNRAVLTRWMLIVCIAMGKLEIVGYSRRYFTIYPEESAGAFDAATVGALEKLFAHRTQDETVYIVPYLTGRRLDPRFKPFWYAHILFFGGVDPRSYQRDGFDSTGINQYGGQQSLPDGSLLLRPNCRNIREGGQIRIVRNDEPLPEGAKLIDSQQYTPDPADPRRFEIFRIKSGSP